ncbi:hypothetical protein [Xanthobacter tagetidis]|nr:hypothetical protein [Xanthobacter tagetidis]MBB6306614.1 hypothetical protein [Xanthobacter tagetidis]
MGRDVSTMKRWRLLGLIVMVAALASSSARAQVPPHQPGTICFTPYFWCWAQPPGPPGAYCGCPGPYGWVQGILG